MSIADKISTLNAQLGNVTLVAVSKTKPVSDIEEAYAAGQRDFGENYVQELTEKHAQLPKDIRWHMIGHLQSNKVKYIAPFVHLIHGVDSLKLLQEINKQGKKNGRVIDCLLQVHIAMEETKFGFYPEEIMTIIGDPQLEQLSHVRIRGLMTMGSNTDNEAQIKKEFEQVKELFDNCRSAAGSRQLAITDRPISDNSFTILSMGMSGDFELAVRCGSNMVRVGSLIFGERNYRR